MKKYFLFDLDGTLTDPKIGITTCVQYALKDAGIDEPDLDKLEPFIGPPLKDSFQEFYGMTDEQANKAVAKYRERFQDVGIFENVVYEGIPAMLKDLKDHGMHLAVASSKPTVYVKRILEHFHIERYFEVIVGSELDGTRVNKDEIVQEALNQFFPNQAIRREEVYMIGDRKFDTEGAKAMQVESVGVAYGYGDIEELKEAGTDYIVQTVGELHAFLRREIRGDEDISKRLTMSQKIWAIAYPVLMFLILRGLVSYALVLLGGERMEYTGNSVAILSTIASSCALLFIWKRVRKGLDGMQETVRLQYLRGDRKSSYVLLYLGVVGGAIGFNLLLSLTGITALSESYNEVASSQYSTTFWIGILCFGFLTPLVEELLFRGLVYGYLRCFTTVRYSLLISAILFSVYHGNSVQGIYAFLMGGMIAYGYEYFGQFLVPVVMHMLANILIYSISYRPVAFEGALGIGVCVIALAVMSICFWQLHRRKNILL